METATANTLPQSADAGALWIHIVPKGEVENESAGILQVFDDESLAAILSNIEADRQRLGSRWPGIYAGREHFIYDDQQDSEALAWFKEFELRRDGIWANGSGLTEAGREAIAGGRYKFTSLAGDLNDTENLGGNRRRILKVDTIGFTNNPCAKELLTPITNRRASLILNVDTLGPEEAAVQVKAEAQQLARERNWTFEEAWQYLRFAKPALFNRMSAQSETPRQPEARQVRKTTRQQFACDALRTLAEDEQRSHGIPFSDAWPRVCNRHANLNKLANRLLPESAWDDMDRQAFEVFTSGINLGPDGKKLHIVPDRDEHGRLNKNSSRRCFETSWDCFTRHAPDLSPREVWDRIKEEHPNVFWPFVAMLAA
jgi:hypothetical protein